MTMTTTRRIMRTGSATLILAGLLGLASMANADDKKKAPPAPPPAKSAPAAAPAPRPAGNPGGAVYHPGGAPSTNQPYRPGPSANQPNNTGPSANHPTTNGQTNNGGAGRNTTYGPGAGTRTPGSSGFAGTPSRTPIRSSTVYTPRNTREMTSPTGSAMRIRPNGKPSDFHDAQTGIDIHKGLSGGERASLERPDHSRTVFERGRPGYVQHPFSFRNREFAQRSYFYHGRAYNHLYYGYNYRGRYLNVYAPGMYYGPGFYGWAYNPWTSPIVYGWGFAGSPWYGYYGYYFSPYTSYPSASYWLTDYMISSDLQTAYAAQQEGGEVGGVLPGTGGSPELTPEVKQQIADEVRNQLALENQEASLNAHQAEVDPGSSGIDRMLSDAARGKQHVFVVGAALDVVDSSQTECSLSDGDVLALQTAPPADARAVDLVVLSSKGGQECQKQAVVSVAFEDLQEMQNHMRETIDQGLQELQAKQGKGGIPAVPSSASVQLTTALYATVAPASDSNAAAEIQQQAQQADQSEREVAAQATQPQSN